MAANPQADRQSFTVRLARLQRVATDNPLLVLIGLLLALMVITNIVSPGFLLPGNFSTTLLIAGPMGLLTAGQTVVILTGGIDLSTTGTATIAAYCLVQYGGPHPLLAVLGALGIGVIIGLINGIGVGPFGVPPLIMTLGMSGIITGLLTVWAANTSNIPIIPDAVRQIGAGKWLTYIPIDVVLWGAITVVLLVLLRGSGFGRAVYAVGANPVASRLAGVRNWQVLLAVYTLCGLLSAAAGILLAGQLGGVDTSLAASFLLPSVAAVVIGGTSILGGSGGYAGSIVGVLILTVLESLLILLHMAEALRQVLYGVIVLSLAWIYARTAGGD